MFLQHWQLLLVSRTLRDASLSLGIEWPQYGSRWPVVGGTIGAVLGVVAIGFVVWRTNVAGREANATVNGNAPEFTAGGESGEVL